MVWEGHDTLLDRPVAVKEVLVPHKLDSRQRLQMIHTTSREARTAARLHHRTIIGVFDVAEEDGRPWIVMDSAVPLARPGHKQRGPAVRRPRRSHRA